MRHPFSPFAARLFLSLSLVLPAGAVLADSAVCTAPGVALINDPAGDQGGGPSGAAADILSVSIAEPAHDTPSRVLVLTLKITPGALPASSYWWVHLLSDTGGDSFVSARTPDPTASDPAPIFQYGSVASGSFSLEGPLDPASNYDAATGTITYVVRNSFVGSPGDGTARTITAEAGWYGGTTAQPLLTNPTDDTSNSDQAQGAIYTFAVDGACGGVVESYESDFGQATPSAPGQPRYQVFAPEDGVIAENQQNGEYNIGFNPKTGNIMTFAITFPGHVYRVTPPELAETPMPESCDAQWLDKSPIWSTIPQAVGDPILWTDQDTGRTFEANLVQGPNISYAYSDDDGESWNDANIGGIAGADHETIGSGPYPDGSPYAAIAELRGFVGADGKGRAVYYCSQDVAGTSVVGGATGVPAPRGTPGWLPPDTCVRSDDGGLTWSQIQVAADGSDCGKTHGHVHVAYDGAVYLPVKGCVNAQDQDEQGGAFTVDAGDTWQTFTVPGATRQGPTNALDGSDPSIAIDKNNTLYFCYVAGDGHAYATVGHRDGTNLVWGKTSDIGIAAHVRNASFTEAVGGDAGRAACGFLGTNKEGNYQALDFDGLWYLFMAHTYDGGETWTTVNATPDDPVQGVGGIWQRGGSNVNRNLLDFNEITIDDQGRALYGYDDGCVGPCVQDPTQNAFSAAMRVARQIGGKPLFESADPSEPMAPKAACLTAKSFRTPSHAHLEWNIPDNGGDAITSYQIFRAPSPDGFGSTPVGTSQPGNFFDDRTQDGTAEKLYYKITAVNAHGESVASNVIELPLSPEPALAACTLPGLVLIHDAAGDNTGGAPGQDLQTVSFAEPADQPGKLVITMKVDDLTAPPPSTRWVTYYDQPDGSAQRYVAMVTGNGTPSFEIGTYGRDPSDTVGLYTPDSAPDDTSNSNADGTITIVLDKAALGLKDGDTLKNVATSVRSTSALLGAGATLDSSDSTQYMLRGIAICSGTIDIPEPPPATGGGGTTAGNTARFGGALGLGLLLPFMIGGALRRRIRR
jgi:hypothetical protein